MVRKVESRAKVIAEWILAEVNGTGPTSFISAGSLAKVNTRIRGEVQSAAWAASSSWFE